MIPGCRGTARILQFNWPFYAMAAAFPLLAAVVASTPPAGPASRLLLLPLLAGSAAAVFWAVASICASWAVYDRSPLMAGRWVGDTLGFTPRSWVVIGAGFDQMTPVLRRLFPASSGRTFDIYDPAVMTEPSIARARRWAGTLAEQADPRRLPLGDGSVDAVVLPLSAHELRGHAARRALFLEVGRTLAGDGRVLVVEHLRDAANFVAFGPGFLHFHSRHAWHRCFAEAGLAVHDEFSITPFVRVFVLARPT
jgi:SAM-dependent methyltransferase